jgi:hypothetical protein
LKETLEKLKKDFSKERALLLKENTLMKTVITEIRDVFKLSGRGDIMNLPRYIREFKEELESKRE